jgi:PAS domain S-box-containing protein
MAIPLRVLVAEDTADDAELMLLELSRGGFDPVSKRVESAEEMRAALAEGAWDIVLSDNAMPGFGAAAALALCREADPDLPFVVVSGTIGEERAVEMMRAGAGDYFLKGNLIRLAPVVERELREAVNRRARHRADQSASELAAIVESTDDAIISKTLDGFVTSWNHAAERLHGWTAEEAIGRHISFIVPPDKVGELDRMMDRLRRGERIEHFETGRLRKDGTRIGVSITISSIRDRHGRLTGISKISRDISGQQRLQRDLRNQVRQQEVVAELGRSALLGGDLTRLLEEATRTVAETLGTEFCKVLELLPDGQSLLLRTGVGWKAELFGRATVPAGTDSHAGYALLAGEPVVVDDYRAESRFKVMPLLHEMGIVSGVSVIIRGRELSFGILEVHTVRQRSFSLDELNFLRSVANVLAAAVESRHAQDALGLSEDRLRCLVQSDLLGIIGWDTGGGITQANDAFLRLFGYSRDDLLAGRVRWTDMTPPEYRPQDERAIEEMRVGGRHIPYEKEYLRKDGRRVPILISAAMMSGATDQGVAFVLDISDRKHAAVERDRLLARLRMQIDRMPLGYLLFDANFRLIDWNATSERIFGYRKDEVLGMGPPYPKIVPPSAWPQGEEILRRLRTGDMSAHMVNHNLTKDGRTITCQWYNTPLTDHDGDFTGLLALAEDITQRVQLEEQFRQAQKMEAFGQLAGGVAHDFNNLLCIINGYSELLLQGLSPGDKTRGLLTEILSAGERSASLTRQLLAFSRKQIVAPKILDVNAIVTEAEKMLRRLIGEDVLLATSLADGLGTVQADEGQLHQVLLNLAVNARDAMPQGGRLTIETRNVELDEEYRRTHSEVSPGPYVLLTVSDTGCGMTAAVKARLFEPFFTTKEVGKGTGLGLAVIHGVVKQAGGHVEVSSDPGVGTTFKVYLPRADRPTRSAMSMPAVDVLPRGTETVLMVEDDEGVRLLTRHMLKGFGYTVLEAASGPDALRIAGKHAGPLHLLITDVVMPGMSGRQVAEEMASLYPEARVLFVSGYTADAVVRHGILEDKVHFLPKPFSPSALARKIREVLDSPGPDRA